MKLLIKINILLITIGNTLLAQSLNGTITTLSNQKVKFGVFDGLEKL
jgi:hypothetical protein